MADHVRTQIRDRALNSAVLGNLSTSGARVYKDRATPLNHSDIGAGALVVWCGDEADPEIVSMNVPRKYRHLMPLHVDLYVHTEATNDWAKTLDTMEKEVDAALLGDFESTRMNALVRDVVKGGSDREEDGDGNKVAGTRRLTFMVEYQILGVSPDTVAA